MSSNPPSKIVYAGDLNGSETEEYFSKVFSPICKIRSFKKFKEPNSNSFYGFIETESIEQATMVIRLFNGKPRPFSNK